MEQIQLLVKSDQDQIQKEAPTEHILELEVTAPALVKHVAAPPLNLALVIDRSGSMSGEKLEQVKSAVMSILNLLRPDDLISLVMFDDQVRILCRGISATDDNKRELSGTVRSLTAGGSTDLCSGYLSGCRSVADQPMQGRLNRVLLLTDGEANVGITDPRQISDYTSELFERGITTTTFGVGLGFNELLLQIMADRGGGNTYFIQEDHQIQAFLMQEFTEMGAISAQRTEITLTFPPACTLEVFGEWRHRFHNGTLLISLSDLVAESVTKIMIKVLTPPGTGELIFNAEVAAASPEGRSLSASSKLVLKYASLQDVQNAPRDRELLGNFASILLGQVTRKVILLEREGQYPEAESLLKNTLDEYGSYAPQTVRTRFEKLKHEILFGLDELTRKDMSQTAYDMQKSRHRNK